MSFSLHNEEKQQVLEAHAKIITDEVVAQACEKNIKNYETYAPIFLRKCTRIAELLQVPANALIESTMDMILDEALIVAAQHTNTPLSLGLFVMHLANAMHLPKENQTLIRAKQYWGDPWRVVGESDLKRRGPVSGPSLP